MSDEQVGEGGSPAQLGGQATESRNNGLAIAGWITAVIVPLPVGIVIGAILASRDDKRGRYILGVAIAISLIWIVYVVVLLQAAEQTRHTYYQPY